LSLLHPLVAEVVAYYRVSTARQGESGYGLEAQRVAVAGLLARQGHSLVAEFTEVESGRKADRPKLAEALSEARQHKAILCVAKLDRLARDVELIARLVKEAERNGFGGLLFADFPDVDPTTAEGELFINQMAAFAQFEARRISQRTKAGLAVAKAKGVVLGGKRPGQERANGARRDQASAAAERYRGILAPMASHGASLREMGAALKAAGVLTTGGSTNWSPSQVKRVLLRLGV
jgi:DNA invertase Pin-like site-specific DNA recombinase